MKKQKKKPRMAMGPHYKSQQGEEVFDNKHHQKSDEGSGGPISLLASLKACAKKKDLHQGSLIHAKIVKKGLLRKSAYVGCTLVSMYAKCGALAKAQEVFDELPIQNIVSWTALLAGYAHYGLGEEAINCFEQMQFKGFSPDAVTYSCILKACGSIAALDKGQEIHAEIVKRDLLGKDIVLDTALVDMYVKCSALAKAQETLDELPVRHAASWNALIAGFAQHGHGEEAINCFEQMQLEGLSPDAVTFACMLRACGSIGAADQGQEFHNQIVRKGLLEKNIVVGTALVGMYAKCGAIEKAQELFDELSVPDLVSWTALIAGYAQHGHGEKAISCFEQMQLVGLYPDAYTFACILKACGSIGAGYKGLEIHAKIIEEGILEKNEVVGTALVDMYAKCGALTEAQVIFDDLPVRNVVSWNALITGYAQHEYGEEAITCFELMQLEGICPGTVTFTCILKACGSIGAAYKGQLLHAEVVKEGLLEENDVIGTALVDMYAKCGALREAQDVFEELPVRDLPSWNALIAGYAQNGQDAVVFESFDSLLREGKDPNLVTFTMLLNTCTHSGLLDNGLMYFETMSKTYGIIPTLEHHTCMVDLFSRSGHLDKAMAVIMEMPFSANLTVWLTVLGGCQKWGNAKLARFAFERSVQLDENHSAAYACMNNIYAAAGMQEDANMIEDMQCWC